MCVASRRDKHQNLRTASVWGKEGTDGHDVEKFAC